MLEAAQLCERETRTRLELHSLQGALEREKLDRERAEQETADTKDSLLKVNWYYYSRERRDSHIILAILKKSHLWEPAIYTTVQKFWVRIICV